MKCREIKKNYREALHNMTRCDIKTNIFAANTVRDCVYWVNDVRHRARAAIRR